MGQIISRMTCWMRVIVFSVLPLLLPPLAPIGLAMAAGSRARNEPVPMPLSLNFEDLAPLLKSLHGLNRVPPPN
ncbi:hypothetical protein FRC12_003357, partial [Ceratobasidium sp. 428]